MSVIEEMAKKLEAELFRGQEKLCAMDETCKECRRKRGLIERALTAAAQESVREMAHAS